MKLQLSFQVKIKTQTKCKIKEILFVLIFTVGTGYHEPPPYYTETISDTESNFDTNNAEAQPQSEQTPVKSHTAQEQTYDYDAQSVINSNYNSSECSNNNRYLDRTPSLNISDIGEPTKPAYVEGPITQQFTIVTKSQICFSSETVKVIKTGESYDLDLSYGTPLIVNINFYYTCVPKNAIFESVKNFLRKILFNLCFVPCLFLKKKSRI